MWLAGGMPAVKYLPIHLLGTRALHDYSRIARGDVRTCLVWIGARRGAPGAAQMSIWIANSCAWLAGRNGIEASSPIPDFGMELRLSNKGAAQLTHSMPGIRLVFHPPTRLID